MDQNYNGRPEERASSESPARHKKKKKRSVGRIIAKTVGWIFLTVFTICVIGILTAGIFAKIFMTYVDTTLIPSLGDVTSEEMKLALASTIYDKNGTPILPLYDNSEDTGGNRELVKYSEIPRHLIDALVSIEDHRFWEHHGVDWVGTVASIRDTLLHGNTRGGSTITQQLLRIQYDDKDVTVRRKFREICRALEYEKSVGKEDIITDYLNTVYFGAGAYGIQTAAKTYFGKDVSELSVAESACIVGITNNPSLYDPLRDVVFEKSGMTPRQYNKKRQETILDEMVKYGYLTEAEASAAKAEKLIFTDTDEYKALHGIEVPEETDDEKPVDLSKIYTWFEDEAINEAITLLAEQYGYAREYASKLLYRGGFHIYTTLDPQVQAVVDEVFQDTSNFDYPSKKGTPINAAITVIDPYTGEVKAIAGDVGVKTVNRAKSLATTPRMPGSSIKPVAVYAPAIDADVVSPASVIDDYPINNTLREKGYPRNSNGRYRGYTTVARGLQNSTNTISSRTLQKLGYAQSFEFMQNNLGFQLNVNDIDLAPLAMGGLTYGVTTMEMAAAYGAFVNRGTYIEPHLITRIESNDHKETVIDNTIPKSWPAMKETTAYLMNKLLRRVVTSGTGGDAAFSGMTIAGKTGTTTDNCDRYFAGYTPYYSAAVWMGYKDKPEKIFVKHGENPSAVVWKLVMEKLHEGLEDKGFFERPEGITSVTVCADCGLKATDLCRQDYRGDRTVSEEIQASAAPKESCTCHIEVQVCILPESEDIYLANEYCPEDTVTTRVMLVGRQFLGEPGSYILAEDSDAHKTYLESKGPCPLHDENYVPDPTLPEEGEPLPGDPDYQWPVGPFDPDSVLPGWDNPSVWTPPDNQEPGTGDPETGEPPVVDPGAAADPGEEAAGQLPQEPEDPMLPEEPVLP
jgi:penicillin-binding protein 1A